MYGAALPRDVVKHSGIHVQRRSHDPKHVPVHLRADAGKRSENNSDYNSGGLVYNFEMRQIMTCAEATPLQNESSVRTKHPQNGSPDDFPSIKKPKQHNAVGWLPMCSYSGRVRVIRNTARSEVFGEQPNGTIARGPRAPPESLAGTARVGTWLMRQGT